MNGKRIIAYFLFALLSIKMLLVPFVYLDFELRKEFIIKNLCENRFKPELHCDGKCYLAKQLTKVAEGHAREEAQKQQDTFKKITQEVFDELTFVFLPVQMTNAERVLNTHYLPPITSEFTTTLLRPPAALS
ncbi:hypothetical protein FHS57_005458 [Runella defluvii]|uniref:Uncharacterized protein n=1 Tax=Runella defluvii TaxID=370973 RepID=A0A7W5ZPT2_9BACT|nr:hypothetical protein [Runella defluvii]MBB3841430.1 hypothetical protein [Runella defluvii]